MLSAEHFDALLPMLIPARENIRGKAKTDIEGFKNILIELHNNKQLNDDNFRLFAEKRIYAEEISQALFQLPNISESICLLDACIQANKESIFIKASALNDAEMIKHLMQYKPSVETIKQIWLTTKNLSVMQAIFEGDVLPQKDLLTMKNHLGCTALHLAAKNGLLDLTKFLVDKGADPNTPDKYGRTPMDLAEMPKTTQHSAGLFNSGKINLHEVFNYLKEITIPTEENDSDLEI